MRKSDATYVAGAVFANLFALVYCFIHRFHIRVLRYYPLEHTWKWFKEEGVPSQGWYGMQMFAFPAAGLVAVVVYFVLKYTLANTRLKPVFTRTIGIITSMVVLSCMGYIFCHEVAIP